MGAILRIILSEGYYLLIEIDGVHPVVKPLELPNQVSELKTHSQSKTVESHGNKTGNLLLNLTGAKLKLLNQIPLSLLQELSEVDDLSDFLQYVDNVTLVPSSAKELEPRLLGTEGIVDG